MDANFLRLLTDNDEDNLGADSSPLSAMLPGLLSTLIGDPEMMGETLRNLISKYKPAVYALLEELFTSYEDLANNQRVFKAQAQMKWNAYTSYLQAGFTPEQAMLFMIDSDASRRNIMKQLTSTLSTAALNS